MNKGRFIFQILAVAVFMIAATSAANAQATRTWVSGVGDDVNPCSRTAPCKTWAGAISKTAAGGEIDALDPGGFGTLTITKSIVIEGTNGQGFGSTLNSGGINGFIINDGASATPNTAVVRLRNLSINGAGTTLGLNGIRFIAGAQLSVENCRIMNQSGDGIRVETTVPVRLVVTDTIITDCTGDGIEMSGAPAAGNSAVTVDRSNMTRNGNGFRITGKASAAISNTVISHHTSVGGKAVEAASATVAGAIIDLENCQVNFNTIAVQPNANNAIRLSNVHMTGNGNALNFNGGTIASFGNNKIVGNAAGEVFASLTDVLQQ